MKKEIYRRNIADLKRQKKGLQYNYTQLIFSFFIYFQTLLVEAQVHRKKERKVFSRQIRLLQNVDKIEPEHRSLDHDH